MAVTHTTDEIRQYLQADSLAYLSQEGMVKATGLPADAFCMACYDGGIRCLTTPTSRNTSWNVVGNGSRASAKFWRARSSNSGCCKLTPVLQRGECQRIVLALMATKTISGRQLRHGAPEEALSRARPSG